MDLPEQVPGAERSQFALLKSGGSCPSSSPVLRCFQRQPVPQRAGGIDHLRRHVPPGQAAVLSNLAQGLFILPFFLFSALAGQLADKYEKSRLIRRTRLAEVI
jgi:hypothetical protein